MDAKIATTKGLFDRGLVARDEYQGLLEQRQSAQLSLASAQDDLAGSLKRGSANARQITEMDYLNAGSKLTDLQAQLAHARVTTPVAGVVTRPVATKVDEAGAGLQAGAHVQRGQVVAEIARASDLAVTVKLDEADANTIHEGLPVTVTGPGFPGLILTGHVSGVSNQPSAPDSAGGGSAGGVTFPVAIQLDPLTPSEAKSVRMGMTANVTITLRHADAALVLPPQAVQGGGPSATVLVVDPRTNKIAPRSVSIGGVAPDGVEISAGLKLGERVTWQTAAPPPPTP